MWVYTCAQIELLISDTPIISYKREGGKKHTKGEMEELARKWEEKNGKEEKLDIHAFLRKPEKSG